MKITRHFSDTEFQCRCGCGLLIVNTHLAELAETIRAHVGKPVIVHCVCRCDEHNDAVGGAANSQHLPRNRCRAMDFHVRGMSNRKLRRVMKKLWKKRIITGGLGLYSWGVHVDTGRRRKWGRFWNRGARHEG